MHETGCFFIFLWKVIYVNSFTELVEKIFNERFPYVIDKILASKIPVAFLSAEPAQTAVDVAKKFRSEGLNITHVILADTTPPPYYADK